MSDEIETGPGIIYAGVHPRCPVHGQMRYDAAGCRWVCRGFDGEGCDHTITDEEIFRDAKPIGEVAGITIGIWPDAR